MKNYKTVLCVSNSMRMTSLLHELHWLPICFWVQPEWLVLTFKALHGIGLGYLRNHLFAISSACLTRSNEMRMLWVPHLGSHVWQSRGSRSFLLWHLYCRIFSPQRWDHSWAFKAPSSSGYSSRPRDPGERVNSWGGSIIINIPPIYYFL